MLCAVFAAYKDGFLLLIFMVLGLIASGIMRTSSMCRSPLASSAPVTSTWSANLNRRSKFLAAIP